VLVSCDGINGITNRTLGNGPRWVKMKKYHLSGIRNEPGYSELFRSHRFSTGRQLIMFDVGPGEAEIDIATTGAENLDQLFHEFIHGHRVMREKGVPEAKIRTILGGLNPLGRGELLQGRVIVVGDAAAGFPAEGGMSYGPARQAADIASSFVLRALEAKDPSLLRGYVWAWNVAFAEAFQRDELLKTAYDSLSDDEIDEVYRTYPGDDINRGLIECARSKAEKSGIQKTTLPPF
jgi:flavin-dependent dehydrogenase